MQRYMNKFIFFLLITVFSHTAKAENMQPYQLIDPQEEMGFLVKEFCRPLKFTRSGIRCFLRHSFNRVEYAQDFLPHNFSHLIQFLQFGNSTEQTTAYFQSTVRLFSNKLKSSRYLNAYVFADLLEDLPIVLQKQFEPIQTSSSIFETIKSKIKETLYSVFLSQFSLFKSNPEQFFNDLSEELVIAANGAKALEEKVDHERLAQQLIRFLEIGINKLIWSPSDQEEIWESIKVIAKHLETMMHKKMINEDDLDDLFKSLIERFCYFLEATGTDLSIEVVQNIKKEINGGQLLFVELEEQEQYIETKKERLLDVLSHTEARILARNKGIISEVIASSTCV